jgi:type VI secretion system lysozyme-like protein
MTNSWGANQAGRALLFERLVKDPDQWFGEPTRSLPEPRRTHDREGLRASVLREIRSAITTRCAIPSGTVLALARTTVDYGLPDIDPREIAGANGLRYLAQLVRQVVEAYEPRLLNVDVEVLGPAPEAGRLLLHITGDLLVDSVREPLEFNMPWSPGSSGG